MDDFEKKILETTKGNVIDNIHAIRDESVSKKVCPKCVKSVTHVPFKDDISEREADISGLCQICQDEVFAEPEE